MNFGVIYPQTEYGHDPIAIRDYAQAAEALGYTHITTYEHVLGANPDRPGGWRGPYTHQSTFIEPFVLFSYMAGFTTRIQFTIGVLVLPMRQTALVAKQAATLDVLCNGRFRLGVGVGWNEVEHIAMNQDFHTRGRRVEEQVEVLRLLWTQPRVTYQGRWHDIRDAGLKPLPVQRPIPIWFGGHVDATLRRIARMGDGWLPNFRSADAAQPALDKLDRYLQEAGRARAEIGLEARLPYGDGDVDVWAGTIEGWRMAGATHISLNTMGSGLDTPEKHMEAIRKFAEAGLS
jgi:probable F420-dependent oxidoreductase